MATNVFPVVVPYRIAGTGDALPTLQVNVVASDLKRARDDALLLARAWLRLRFGAQAPQIEIERLRVGQPTSQPAGPHLYILTPTDIIQSICFPARIDSIPGERLGEILLGLENTTVYGVLFGCADMAYINTVGLTSLAAHVRRLKVVLYQVPEPVKKVFEIVGLTRFLTIMPGLEEALVAVPSAV
jgi:anti-anti-sigma regulatory factor